MAKKSESDVLTKTFFTEQMERVFKKVGDLDLKIENVKQSSKEHLEAVARGLNKKIDKLDMKIEAVHDKLDHKIETVRQELTGRMDKMDSRMERMDTKLDRVVDKVEEHDQDIRILKAAVA